MFRAVALVPSPPLLVPELTGGGAPETDAVRDAALDAARRLGRAASKWMAIGVGDASSTVMPNTRGTFQGYGVDVEARLSRDAAQFDPRMPLAALIAAWLRDRTAPDAVVEARIIAADTDTSSCLSLGRELRHHLDASDEEWGLLVVADGAITLTPKAPGSFDDRSPDVQDTIDDALAAADVGFLGEIDRGLCSALGVGGAAAWQVLAGVVEGERLKPTELYRGAPLGVGYFVGIWEPSA
ncbi:class III extradiol dioxygenase subunit B-like domain-containing protein [Rhodococcoides kyotonense]|uniref:class III extradiol dioxygenase subunit B-like domain-containing protein n=1 Tax=Rhodococcoides kyotonense TaxID=398843 RepID=UPI001594F06B|nr:class III extradiol dioxygenase subunit B-like domain-containing protein [Rhodococcus kyotonensis]